jgi:raffinose/stachyose/melibiose transport system permease protein
MFLGALHLGFLFGPYLGEEHVALLTVSLISVWQFVGIPMILIYTALLAIPDELVDAATVDGLNQWQTFFHVKLPLIWPTIGLVSVLTFVNNFNAFDLIYVTEGALAGPNYSTDIMGTLFYRTFFGNQLQLGDKTMGSTIATMMFLFILIGVMIYLFLIQRRMQRYSF